MRRVAKRGRIFVEMTTPRYSGYPTPSFPIYDDAEVRRLERLPAPHYMSMTKIVAWVSPVPGRHWLVLERGRSKRFVFVLGSGHEGSTAAGWTDLKSFEDATRYLMTIA